MITIIVKSLITVGTKLLLSLGSEKLIEWALFKVADVAVASTKTPHDNELLVKIKEAYNKKD